jgi:hypothetical protein
MKRSLIVVPFLALFCPSVVTPQPSNTKGDSHSRSAPRKKVPFRATLADCPDEGCGIKFDPNLNKLKNIHSLDGESTFRSITWMKKLDDPDNFTEGGSREELATLGEGTKITVVAYFLVAKPEGAESCNCGLTKTDETDSSRVQNHH